MIEVVRCEDSLACPHNAHGTVCVHPFLAHVRVCVYVNPAKPTFGPQMIIESRAHVIIYFNQFTSIGFVLSYMIHLGSTIICVSQM